MNEALDNAIGARKARATACCIDDRPDQKIEYIFCTRETDIFFVFALSLDNQYSENSRQNQSALLQNNKQKLLITLSACSLAFFLAGTSSNFSFLYLYLISYFSKTFLSFL